MRYRLSPRAKREASRAHSWWREHRPSAPELFLAELSDAFERIVTAPLTGAPYGTHDGALVRRLLLMRTQFHVYYVIDEVGPLVVSVWSAVRRRGPRLGPGH